MANWQLGKADEARALLAKGESLAPRSMPPSIAQDPGNAWQGWLFARIQLDEAASLILPGAGRLITGLRQPTKISRNLVFLVIVSGK